MCLCVRVRARGYARVGRCVRAHCTALPAGFPVRVIVPGVVGVRNVKWVTKISPSSDEAAGPWQRGIA